MIAGLVPLTRYITDYEPFQRLVAAMRPPIQGKGARAAHTQKPVPEAAGHPARHGTGHQAPRAHVPTAMHGYLLAALQQELWREQTLLLVAPDAGAARALAADIAIYSPLPVRLLPALAATRTSGMLPSQQVVGLRHSALAALTADEPALIVAEAAALQERELDPGAWPEPLQISKEDKSGFDRVIEHLAGLGYERLPQVEDPGQFSVRGGIIDFFPSTESAPYRAEFWGDELESLRRFSAFTQRSLSTEEGVTVFANQEPAAFMPERYDESDGVSTPAAGYAKGLSGGLLERRVDGLRLIRIDPALAAAPVDSFWEDVTESLQGDPGQHYLSPEELGAGLDGKAALVIESLPADQPFSFPATGVNFGARKPVEAGRQLERLAGQGLKVFVWFATEGAARRAAHLLGEKPDLLLPERSGHGESATGIAAGDYHLPDRPGIWFTVGPAPAGFISREVGLASFSDRALLRPGRSARSQELALGSRSLLSFRDLTPGDFVVHQDHGIGLFQAIETKTVAGITRDYLDLRFKGDDRLYVPQEQIYKVTRYIGAGAGEPPLNKLGGKAWALARSRARSAAREMAGELLQLYAVRQSLPGHDFEQDNPWQAELEATFPYIETPDQAAAIDDVKDDMEAPHPMDRLICGDVGYGKTEVALRAAFKAASQGKQVLMLVPTTILALQHYNTFSERFKAFPVNVEMISRFRSAAQSRKIAEAFRAGRIEVLIGTHRVLSPDVVPKDLGLVIVDEEQRFGVTQKETLRQLRLKVDVLSLSATPIPRTLQMSLAGIRDISVMETPPPGRNPIRTYVGEYDDQMVMQAIGRERERGGQVFFLHNRVETIEEKAKELRDLMPGVRFQVAHGQMPERELEQVMVSFLEGGADVLVCTSIIESGLDIPTANTLIVDRADMLGLAQLYQIRGRIGRSRVAAHAYLFFPTAALLTPEAMARLSTLSEYTELGSGFRIAMRDLEIRGAGNLLGDEQSGHVAAVGFDMYCDLLKAAVAELRGKPVETPKMARLDVDVDAYIPGDYIPLEAVRIDIHHRIAAARDEQAIEELKNELEDRFGPVPDVVYNLFDMQEIRLRAAVLGAGAVKYRRGRLDLADLKLDAQQRAVLEQSGLNYVYHPLRRTLGLWLETGDGLPVVKKSLGAIIGSLLTQSPRL